MAKDLQHRKFEATPHPPQSLSQNKKWEFLPNPNLWIGINLMSKKWGFSLRNLNAILKHVCPFCIPIAGCSWSLMLQRKAKHLHELWKVYNLHLDSEMLALSCETSCETEQASLSLQQKLGSASISFTRAQQSHVDVYGNSSGIKYKRKLQKTQIFFASGLYLTPLPIPSVGQVVCHLYMLSYSLALVI